MEYMTAEQAAEAAKGLTFEKVWEALMEDRKNIEEFRKFSKETIKELRESRKDTDKHIKELSANIGGLNNSIGRFIEVIYSAELCKKFDEIGFEFTKQAQNVKFKKNKQALAEVDLFLENGDYVMLVEVKFELTKKDIDKHLIRMEIIREYMDARADTRIIVGAVAGGTVLDGADSYAQEKGLYVVTQSGNAIKIADLPVDFVARQIPSRL